MALVTDKSLFIHVQKSGGMTVRSAMRLCKGPVYESGPVEVERHFGLPELRAAHPGIENGRLTFGFVRHPIAWLRSRWAWARVSGYPAQAKHRPAAAKLWLFDCWSEDFDTFIELYLERHPGVCTRTHCHMLGLWSSTPVARVGRVETLVEDLISILGEAGETFDPLAVQRVGRVNESRPGDHGLRGSLPLRASTWNRVLDAEKPLVERFYGSQEFDRAI